MGSSKVCNAEDTCAVDIPIDDQEVVRRAKTVLMGNPMVVYSVTLRLRGVFEPKGYEGGTTVGTFNEGGVPVEDGWNTASLRVDDPIYETYVNAGQTAARYCIAIDTEITVPVRGGASVEIETIDPNNCSMMNIDAPLKEGGMPFPVDAIDEPHDGQFLLVEALEIMPL
jgi:hypothetical protein